LEGLAIHILSSQKRPGPPGPDGFRPQDGIGIRKQEENE
jgi:hypothetical protein